MEQPTAPVADRPLEGVELDCDAIGMMWIAPAAPGAADVTPFRRFPLPRIPESHLHWLLRVGEAHRRRTGRSVAVMLTLNVADQTWHVHLPWQKCGVECARWRLDRQDGLELGEHERLAGTFQSLVLEDPSEIAQCVPPLAGVHLLQVPAEDSVDVLAYLRGGDGRQAEIELCQLIQDDVVGMLDYRAERLEVE